MSTDIPSNDKNPNYGFHEQWVRKMWDIWFSTLSKFNHLDCLLKKMHPCELLNRTPTYTSADIWLVLLVQPKHGKSDCLHNFLEFDFLQMYLESAVGQPPLDEALLDVGHDVVLEHLLPLLLCLVSISTSGGKTTRPSLCLGGVICYFSTKHSLAWP